MNFRIRFARPADYDWCRGIDDHVSDELLQWKLDRKEIVLAEADNKPVGYLRLEFIWSKAPYLGFIHVDALFRRRGAGRSMLAFLEHELRDRGHSFLLSSSQQNEPEPQAWHQRMGFRTCGSLSEINEDGSDEVFFRKLL